jgi:hypothetical protein
MDSPGVEVGNWVCVGPGALLAADCGDVKNEDSVPVEDETVLMADGAVANDGSCAAAPDDVGPVAKVGIKTTCDKGIEVGAKTGCGFVGDRAGAAAFGSWGMEGFDMVGKRIKVGG